MKSLVEQRRQMQEWVDELDRKWDVWGQVKSAMEMRRAQYSENPNGNSQLQHHQLDEKALQSDIIRHFSQLIFLQSGFLQQLETTLAQLEQSHLLEWIEAKRKATLRLSPAPLRLSAPDHHALAHHYQDLVSHGFFLWKILRKLCGRFQNYQQHFGQVSELFEGAKRFLHQALQSSFVVTQEPPLVVKARVDISVRLLGGRPELGLEGQAPVITAKLIPEDTADKILKGHVNVADKELNIERKGFEEKDAKCKDMEAKDGDCYGADFAKSKLKVENRRGGVVDRASGAAIRKKYYILFYTTLNVDAGSNTLFPLYSLSQPFVYSVHGNQDLDLWGSIIWDTAFPENWTQAPLKGREAVNWSDLEEVLPGAFALVSGNRKFLSEDDVAYLRTRFIPTIPYNQNPQISRFQFFKESLYHLDSEGNALETSAAFSFWDWFFAIADFIAQKTAQTKLPAMWDEGLIYGFISKAKATDLVLEAHVNAFLLRFSDNQTAALSVVACSDGHVQHLRPFRAKQEIEQFKMPELIRNVEELDGVDMLLGKDGQMRQKMEIIKLGAKTKREEEAQTGARDYRPWNLTFNSEQEPTNRKRSMAGGDSLSQLGSPRAQGRCSVPASDWSTLPATSPQAHSIDLDSYYEMIDSEHTPFDPNNMAEQFETGASLHHPHTPTSPMHGYQSPPAPPVNPPPQRPHQFPPP